MSVFKYKSQTMMGGNSEARYTQYDSTESKLEVKNVQDAIDELADNLGGISISYNPIDKHFYATYGDYTKKLGSGEGTATTDQVLVGTTFSSDMTDGEVVEGTMPNNGAINITLDNHKTLIIIEKGYHNGEGSVSINLQPKTVTPAYEEQIIKADSGKVLSTVTVNATPIETKVITPSTEDQVISPSTGKFLSGVTVKGVLISTPTSSQILANKTVEVSSNGNILSSITGDMNDFSSETKSSTSASLSDNNVLINIPSTGYYNTSSKISVTKTKMKSVLSAYTATLSGTTLTLS